MPRVQPGNRARCHTTELRPPAARRRRDHASICMPLVRPILREIVDRYCVSTLAAYAVFHCRLCCCCGCWSNDRSPLDTTQVGRDGGNASAVPSGDRVRRGLAGHRLSSSRVIPGDRRAFTTAQLRVLWPPFLNTLFAGQPYWRTLSLKSHCSSFGRRHLSVRSTCKSDWSSD